MDEVNEVNIVCKAERGSVKFKFGACSIGILQAVSRLSYIMLAFF